MNDLRQNGCALVTGSSRGIGAATAIALAEDGWPVVVNYRTDEAGARAVVELVESRDGRARAVAADVSQPDAAAILTAEAHAAFGPPLVLVNNAGCRADGISMELTDSAWEAVMGANLQGPFRLCRAFLPSMIRRRFGRIVNVASVAGLHASRGQANYAASKAGLVGLTKTLAAEVAKRGVTVNAVAPGYVRTEMTADVPDDVLRSVPAGRFAQPEEIAACVRFLASDDASYVTGTTLIADGGFTA
jgi:3-oxoacyl-[acyl-carrier protein] reductase